MTIDTLELINNLIRNNFESNIIEMSK